MIGETIKSNKLIKFKYMESMNERENERRREEERRRRENDQSQNYGYIGACCV